MKKAMKSCMTGRQLVRSVAMLCRVSELVVEDVLRTTGAVAQEQIAAGGGVKIPGVGRLARSGVAFGTPVRRLSFGGMWAGVIVAPVFWPAKGLRREGPALGGRGPGAGVAPEPPASGGE